MLYKLRVTRSNPSQFVYTTNHFHQDEDISKDALGAMASGLSHCLTKIAWVRSRLFPNVFALLWKLGGKEKTEVPPTIIVWCHHREI